MSTLKALRVLDEFTIGRLAAAAGVRAATLRPLFLRWEQRGFSLLEEIGAERAPTAGQPPKIYVLRAAMVPVIDAAIAAADPEWRPTTEAATPAPQGGARPTIQRLNLLKATDELIAEAGRTEASARRSELIAEASRLLKRSRTILKQREAAGRGSASVELQEAIGRAEQQIVRIAGGMPDIPVSVPDVPAPSPLVPSDPNLLRLAIIDRASELRRRAELYAEAEARARDDEEQFVEYQQLATESFKWLSAIANHYLQTEPRGRDGETAIFGGFLVVRGELGARQNTLLDDWLSSLACAHRTRRERAPDVNWEAVQEAVVAAFRRMAELGCRTAAWYPVLTSALDGIRDNCRLAVLPDVHREVASLVARSRSPDLRQAGHDFLQQYSVNSHFLKGASLPAPDPREPLATAHYFEAQSRLSELLPKGKELDPDDARFGDVDLAAMFSRALAPPPLLQAA